MKKLSITVPMCKPRNPLVAFAQRRLAGPHGRAAGAQRRHAAQALRQELQHLHRHSP
ncbi:MAG: hypothetical protein ACKVQR_16635 [Aquabacterium sp.]